MDHSHRTSFASLLGETWTERLEAVTEMMRDISRQTDPQKLVQVYGQRMRKAIPSDANFSLSRRDLPDGHYRITRSSRWEHSPNPWKSKNQLPIFRGGVVADLIYGEEAVVIDDLHVSDDDPAVELLRGYRSLVAIPLFDKGHALNMVVLLRKDAHAFSRDFLPEHLWLSNLFGRMTHNLVLSDELREAYQTVDRELQVVADIQRSLLPTTMPKIPTLELAVHYQTSRRAGGDYYDFFPLPNGRWGILIADVSGHGTPAAVIMAVTHSIAHTHNEEPDPPSRLLNFINRHLVARYTNGTGTFVTAFYGIYDPSTRTLTYANAGHNPPRHKHAGAGVLGSLESSQNLPLGIESDEQYRDITQQFKSGDSILFYTDGITEARAPGDALFGLERLDAVLLGCDDGPERLRDEILEAVEQFTQGAMPSDDRTLLVARVR
jgi:sigma-B regulation protein RsbU (phosphoserine phosphatase)